MSVWFTHSLAPSLTLQCATCGCTETSSALCRRHTAPLGFGTKNGQLTSACKACVQATKSRERAKRAQLKAAKAQWTEDTSAIGDYALDVATQPSHDMHGDGYHHRQHGMGMSVFSHMESDGEGEEAEVFEATLHEHEGLPTHPYPPPTFEPHHTARRGQLPSSTPHHVLQAPPSLPHRQRQQESDDGGQPGPSFLIPARLHPSLTGGAGTGVGGGADRVLGGGGGGSGDRFHNVFSAEGNGQVLDSTQPEPPRATLPPYHRGGLMDHAVFQQGDGLAGYVGDDRGGSGSGANTMPSNNSSNNPNRTRRQHASLAV